MIRLIVSITKYNHNINNHSSNATTTTTTTNNNKCAGQLAPAGAACSLCVMFCVLYRWLVVFMAVGCMLDVCLVVMTIRVVYYVLVAPEGAASRGDDSADAPDGSFGGGQNNRQPF